MKLSFKPGKLNKIHIYIDEEYRLTVDDLFWFSSPWHNLKEIESEELVALEEAVGSRRAFNAVMDLLSRRDHTKQELLRKLTVKYSEEAARAAVERAEAYGYIDETRFAENYAESLYRNKRFGERRIIQELLRKGISREIAENAVENLDKDGENRIILLLRGKYRTALCDEKGKRRAINGLLRMGYSYAEIRAALSQMETETEEVYDA